MTKDLNSLNELGEEKSFELSVIKLVGCAIVVIYIYSSPDEKIDTFFNKLEMITHKLTGKHQNLIVCGGWNINFLQTSPHTRELNNLHLRYNLKYTVNISTRITKTTATLLGVVITNEKKCVNSLRVMGLGLSDHYTQIISISIAEFSNIPYRINKRQFSEANVKEFLHLLNQVTWQEVYVESDVNAKFSAFMDAFLYCYNNAFPIKTVHMKQYIAEIFLQYLEHMHIRPLKDSKQILFYAHHIDDILIIYNTESTNQDNLT